MSATLIELVDGRLVLSDAESWKHQCEAQWILDMRPLEKRREVLAFIETKRGAATRAALEVTMGLLHKKARSA